MDGEALVALVGVPMVKMAVSPGWPLVLSAMPSLTRVTTISALAFSGGMVNELLGVMVMSSGCRVDPVTLKGIVMILPEGAESLTTTLAVPSTSLAFWLSSSKKIVGGRSLSTIV